MTAAATAGHNIVLISFELRHLEDQPVAVHLCGHHPDAGANPRIRSNPYTTSQDATPSVRPRLGAADAHHHRDAGFVHELYQQQMFTPSGGA